VRAPGPFFRFIIGGMEPAQLGLESPARARRHEFLLVGALCLLAAVHVFVYSAAFPFFEVTDECQHFDTVIKYAHGDIPRHVEFFSPEATRDLALYNSAFTFGASNAVERLPQPWTMPLDQQDQWISAHAYEHPFTNYECTQPPLYFLYTASWLKLSGHLGVSEGNRLYGVRFMNIPFVMLVVWLGWVIARYVFPDRFFVRIAVPAFLAVMPQGTFYSIENDVPSAFLFGVAFLGLLRFWRTDAPGIGLGIMTGLALGTAFINKINSTFSIIALLMLLLLRALHLWRAGNLKASVPSFLAVAVCAGPPMAAWMAWCKINIGDFTGTKPRVDYWGLTPKPFLQWWHHPIFTPHGTAKFLDHFLPQLWQGELFWHQHMITIRLVDLIYTVATVAVLAVLLVQMARRPQSIPLSQRQVLWMSFFIFGFATSFLIYCSLSFDFHNCPNPSREIPYLFCARNVLPALIPFMLLFVSGLDILLGRMSVPQKFAALGALLALIVTVEAVTNRMTFPDPYNWYHMNF
jgi:hypothetical protein